MSDRLHAKSRDVTMTKASKCTDETTLSESQQTD